MEINLNDIIQYIPINYILTIIITIIISLWLKSYNPPIKKQWQSLILFLIGGLLGFFVIGKTVPNVLIGISVSGLVFFKDKLVEEIKLFKDNINILNLITKNNKDKEDGDTDGE